MLDEKEIRRRLFIIKEIMDHTKPNYDYLLGITRAYKDVLEVDEAGKPYIKVIEDLIA